MGHEVIIYGAIEGVATLPDYQSGNENAIKDLPVTGDWPLLSRSMFQFPTGNFGMYQTQIIHFGLSMKDGAPLDLVDDYDPLTNWRNPKRQPVTSWIEQFEALLRKMFWYGADVCVSTDFEPDRKFSYAPKANAISSMLENLSPINVWDLSVVCTTET